MDKEQIIQSIIDLCYAKDDSFLVLLHSWNTFDEEKYQTLIESIKQYDVLLGDNPDINRKVADCLFGLIEQLEVAMHRYEKEQDPRLKRVEAAHAESWELVNKILAGYD